MTKAVRFSIDLSTSNRQETPMPLLFLLILFVSASGAALAQEHPDWPEFRGPGGQGVSPAKDLPWEWSEKKNVAWKSAVPGKGWSSPMIAGGIVWLTTATEVEGKPSGRALRLLAFNRETGEQTRDVAIFELDNTGAQHAKNSFASPTPVFDSASGLIFVHFGVLGTAAVKAESGEIAWKTTLPAYQHVHGGGGSPVVWRDLLIVACDGTDTQYVVALEKATGEIRWRKPRPSGNMAFSTPLIIEAEGKPQLIAPSAHRTIAYDPETGKELWWVEYGDGFSNVPRPVFAHGLVYLCTGFYRPQLLAVKPDGEGDVTGTHIVWRAERGVPLTPSPIVAGDEILMVSDNGILSCLDAKTGKLHYQERLGANFSASPLFADGRVYWQSEEGETTVIAPGPEFRKLGSNAVEGQTFASLAVSGNSLFLRSATHLYRISAQEE
jgi:outer membrane protein assembly factor BamB